MNVIQRMNSDTPKFFKVIRNIGLALGAAGGVLATAPVGLPAAVVTIGGYLATAGAVASAVAQTATTGDDGSKKAKR
jgi:ABC-type xylose transport system permease subunit